MEEALDRAERRPRGKRRKTEKRDAYARMLDRELPKEPPGSCGLQLASFFCGCGGVDLGFRSAGFELAFSNDIFQSAAVSFAENLGHEPMVEDIRNVDARQLEGIDVLTGGFPCVTFSTAGRRKGVVDDINGKLYLELCRVIREARPRYFVAENVKGILSANGGDAMKLVLAAFYRLGYYVFHQLVDMSGHGIPQTRHRVIFVGIREDQFRGAFRFPKQTHKVGKGDPAWLPPPVSLRAAIGDLGEPAVGVRNADFFNPVRDADGPCVAVTGAAPELSVPNHDQVSEKPAYKFVQTQRVNRRSGPSMTIVTKEQDVQFVPANHERNDAPPPKVDPTAAHAGGAAPGEQRGRVRDPRKPGATVAGGPGDAPFIPNQDQRTTFGVGERYHGTGHRQTKADEPSPSIIGSTGGGTPMLPNQDQRSEASEGKVHNWMQQRQASDDEPVPSIVSRGPPPFLPNQDQRTVAGPTAFGCSERGADESEPSPTIAGAHAAGVPWHPNDLGIRRMSVRECARVQSFPDWFAFHGSMSECYKQVGNAVPPLYAKRLAEAIAEYDRRSKCRPRSRGNGSSRSRR